jgi:putative SOS response-associated peptidase YedK
MTNQEAIQKITGTLIDSIGNLQPSRDVYLDRVEPIMRNTPAGWEMTTVRWGMPTPPQVQVNATKERAAKLEAKGSNSTSRNC